MSEHCDSCGSTPNPDGTCACPSEAPVPPVPQADSVYCAQQSHSADDGYSHCKRAAGHDGEHRFALAPTPALQTESAPANIMAALKGALDVRFGAIKSDPDAAVRAIARKKSHALFNSGCSERTEGAWEHTTLCELFTYGGIQLFAAGRAMGRDEGVRDEREACETTARYSTSGSAAADAIAARGKESA